jgi:hypothetical protein
MGWIKNDTEQQSPTVSRPFLNGENRSSIDLQEKSSGISRGSRGSC